MGRELEKSVKQWLGVFIAIVSYYIIHEGTHLLLALILGVFEKIRFVGIWGIQIVTTEGSLKQRLFLSRTPVYSQCQDLFQYLLNSFLCSPFSIRIFPLSVLGLLYTTAFFLKRGFYFFLLFIFY